MLDDCKYLCLTVLSLYCFLLVLCREHLKVGTGLACSKGNGKSAGQMVEVGIVMATSSLEPCCWRANSLVTQVGFCQSLLYIWTYFTFFIYFLTERAKPFFTVRWGIIFMLNFLFINILGLLSFMYKLGYIWAYEG